MRLNLRAKVILTISLFLVAVFALSMYLSLVRNINQLHSNLDRQAKSFASLATPPIGNTFVLYKDSGRIKINQQVDRFLALDPDVTGLRIVSVDGKQLYDSRGKQHSPIKSSLASSFKPKYIMSQAGNVSEVVQPYFEDSGAHRYSMVYTISTKRVAKSVNDAVRLVLYVGIAIMVASIAATSLALNILFIRPLREVSRSADAISAGNYNRQITTHAGSRDEIGKLAQAVNRMADSLKADIVKLKGLDKMKSEFMMIASHNLRTPLAVMHDYMEMARDAGTVRELKAVVAAIQDSVVRLNLLSEDLLTISTLETGGESMEKTPTEAAKFIDSAVSEFKLLAAKKQLRWHYKNDLPAGARLDLAQANMRSALGNIIDNAIKFTEEGGLVEVNAAVKDGRLVFKVRDTGIGISPGEIPKLFTKFHRGTSTYTYDYEGAGIGLYLTKLIVEKHGGRVHVDSEVGEGSTFTVDLPLAPPGRGAHPPAA